MSGRAGQPWGWEVSVDLTGCDPRTFTTENISGYAQDLVARIGMKAYGDPIVEFFGYAHKTTAGPTLVQLIETSSITAHFATADGRVFLTVFSCRDFDPHTVVQVTEGWFGGDGVIVQRLERG